MQAKDIMTTKVITVAPDADVAEIAETLLGRRISAVPVVDNDKRILGIISEGDLMRRPETDTEGPRSWWLAFLTLPDDDSRRFIKTHSRHAHDIMTRTVTTIDEDTPLHEIASLLEEKHIKRAPVVRDGVLVGIVSRADLLRGLAASKSVVEAGADDRSIREAVERAIEKHTGLDDLFIDIKVSNGVVHLWGGVEEPGHRDAARVAAEGVPGVKAVENRINVFRPSVRATLWGW